MSTTVQQITDHAFQPSKRLDSCDFTNWQARGPWLVCDLPAANHLADRPEVTFEELHAEYLREIAAKVKAEQEVKRLRTEIATWGRMWDDADLLGYRAEGLRNGTAIRGSLPGPTPHTPTCACHGCLGTVAREGGPDA